MNNLIFENKKTYDALADQYEGKVSARENFNRGVVERFSKFVKPGGRVLDVGCAVGLDAKFLSDLGFEVSAIENSRNMIAYAKKRNPGIEITEGDFMTAEFPERFDGVFAQAFIHLFPKDEALRILGKIRRILKEGGTAHVTTSVHDKGGEGWLVKTDYQGRYSRFRKHWTRPEMEEALRTCGFGIVDTYDIADPYGKKWMVFSARREIGR
jgi:SAM-dependent methyltransferase